MFESMLVSMNDRIFKAGLSIFHYQVEQSPVVSVERHPIALEKPLGLMDSGYTALIFSAFISSTATWEVILEGAALGSRQFLRLRSSASISRSIRFEGEVKRANNE